MLNIFLIAQFLLLFTNYRAAKGMTMEHPEIFSATLGISHPWHVTSIEVLPDGTRLDITIDCVTDGLFSCPRCGIPRTSCCSTHEVWHHGDFFNHETYLHARVPHIDCACSGRQPVDRPWSRAGSRFIQTVQ